ncbi:MAG: YggS family pyridoxal phosphate-dependent enzyme [Sphingobacteriales bacterium]|nr:YggS family pyridoxal phosphate-dependent enzyme [Sphingobacteriales bacterium]MCC7222087.1 YggS family pyridoxal phosphate-dependent enzyme [Chitinophagales bacterium]
MNEKDIIIENISTICRRIENTCHRIGRNPKEVKLLLATKTVSAEKIKIALETGTTLIGENKVQEIKEKYECLKDTPHTKHFIGHLQTNKVKELLKFGVSCIQSLDRLDLAEKLQQRLESDDKSIEAFIQVNTSYEESKFGLDPSEVLAFSKQVSQLNRIKIKGLMTIGLFSADTEKVRKCFRLLKEIQQKIIAENIPNIEVNELSMGMSGDLETAVEEGTTIIRVGTAIFGQRIYPDSYYWNEQK